MLQQCSRNIKANEDYNPPYDSPPPITPPHPLLHLSSPHSSPPPLKPTSKSNTWNYMFQNTQQNTPASVALSPVPITVTIKLMMIPFSTQLDCLSPFACCLLYATILKSTTAYQALHALPYFSTDDTLTQLAILFWIYSTLHTLFTRAT